MRRISALGWSSDLRDLPEMNVRVALATSDVKSILEISATDEIHMEDQNHGLASTKPNSDIYNTQHSQQTCAFRVKFISCGS